MADDVLAARLPHEDLADGGGRLRAEPARPHVEFEFVWNGPYACSYTFRASAARSSSGDVCMSSRRSARAVRRRFQERGRTLAGKASRWSRARPAIRLLAQGTAATLCAVTAPPAAPRASRPEEPRRAPHSPPAPEHEFARRLANRRMAQAQPPIRRRRAGSAPRPAPPRGCTRFLGLAVGADAATLVCLDEEAGAASTASTRRAPAPRCTSTRPRQPSSAPDAYVAAVLPEATPAAVEVADGAALGLDARRCLSKIPPYRPDAAHRRDLARRPRRPERQGRSDLDGGSCSPTQVGDLSRCCSLHRGGARERALLGSTAAAAPA